jgi:transposase
MSESKSGALAPTSGASASKSGVKPRRSFTEEFKQEAVRLAIERGNVCATARDLGISDSCLDRWKRAVENAQNTPNVKAFPGNGNSRDEEMAKLQRELARLKEDNEILKKAVGIFTKESR